MPKIKLATFLLLLLPFIGVAQGKKDYLSRGKDFIEKGQKAEGISIIKKYSEAFPNDIEPYIIFAENEAITNNYEDGSAYYIKAWKIDSNAFKNNWMLDMGLMLKQNGDYLYSKRIFEYLLTKNIEVPKTRLKAEQEVKAINTIISEDFLAYDVEITPVENINTFDAEFGATPVDDYAVIFNRLEGLHDSLRDIQELKILFAELEPNSKDKPILYKSDLKSFVTGVHKPDFSDLIVYSRCNSVNDCRLYSGKLKGTRVVKEKPIEELNLDSSNSVHPFLVESGGQLLLFFSSTKEGGYGGFDIYVSFLDTVLKEWQPAINLGPKINTIEDEISPYYDPLRNKVYFSSNWHGGFGGFDIFVSNWNLDSASTPINLGEPFNSPANDTYFYVAKGEEFGLLTSNRKGSLTVEGLTCCNDIYQFPWPPPLPIAREKVPLMELLPIALFPIELPEYTLIDTYFEVPVDTIPEKEVIVVEEKPDVPLKTMIEDFKLITLYFHNDEPNPRSTSTYTNLTYEECYNSYRALTPEYLRKNRNSTEIDEFFNETLPSEYEKLLSFIELLKKAKQENKRIKITIRGHASPLGQTDYNDALGKRRTNSLKNQIIRVSDGFLADYMRSEKVKIELITFGERETKKEVSDDYFNTRKSIYSLPAMLERRIEIESIQVLGNPAKSKPIKYAYGIVASGNEKVKRRWRVYNPNETPFQVKEIQTSCGCSVATMEKSEIPAFGTAFFDLEYEPKEYEQTSTKTIRFIPVDNTLKPIDVPFKVIRD